MAINENTDRPNDAPETEPVWNVRGKPERLSNHEILVLALLLIGDVLDAELFWRARASGSVRGIVSAVPRPPAGTAVPAGSVLWVVSGMRFILPGGLILTPASVRAALLAVIARSSAEMRADNARMIAGTLALAAWADLLINRTVALHVAAAAVGAGGVNQLPGRTLARSADAIPPSVSAVRTLGDYVTYHVARAAAFARQIAERATNADTPGKINTRTDLYNNAATGAYALGQREAALAAGLKYERNVLTAAEHCTPRPGDDTPDCPGETSRGWVPIGELSPIGARVCMSNCKCFLEFSASNAPNSEPDAGNVDPAPAPEPAPA